MGMGESETLEEIAAIWKELAPKWHEYRSAQRSLAELENYQSFSGKQYPELESEIIIDLAGRASELLGALYDLYDEPSALFPRELADSLGNDVANYGGEAQEIEQWRLAKELKDKTPQYAFLELVRSSEPLRVMSKRDARSTLKACMIAFHNSMHAVELIGQQATWSGRGIRDADRNLAGEFVSTAYAALEQANATMPYAPTYNRVNSFVAYGLEEARAAEEEIFGGRSECPQLDNIMLQLMAAECPSAKKRAAKTPVVFWQDRPLPIQ